MKKLRPAVETRGKLLRLHLAEQIDVEFLLHAEHKFHQVDGVDAERRKICRRIEIACLPRPGLLLTDNLHKIDCNRLRTLARSIAIPVVFNSCARRPAGVSRQLALNDLTARRAGK